jgi:hypothetical protein
MQGQGPPMRHRFRAACLHGGRLVLRSPRGNDLALKLERDTGPLWEPDRDSTLLRNDQDWTDFVAVEEPAWRNHLLQRAVVGSLHVVLDPLGFLHLRRGEAEACVSINDGLAAGWIPGQGSGGVARLSDGECSSPALTAGIARLLEEPGA